MTPKSKQIIASSFRILEEFLDGGSLGGSSSQPENSLLTSLNFNEEDPCPGNWSL